MWTVDHYNEIKQNEKFNFSEIETQKLYLNILHDQSELFAFFFGGQRDGRLQAKVK